MAVVLQARPYRCSGAQPFGASLLTAVDGGGQPAGFGSRDSAAATSSPARVTPH
nr:hypothetical protein [Klebsiella variicola]